MSNPFAKFALSNNLTTTIKKETSSNGGSGGWMATKKRGRDDVTIQRDRSKAREAWKQRRRSGGGAGAGRSNSRSSWKSTKKSQSRKKAKPTTTRTATARGRKATQSKKKTKNYSSDEFDDDDDNSIDDFVVDDDEDVSEEQLSSSEDEALIVDDEDDDDDEPRSSSTRNKARKKTIQKRNNNTNNQRNMKRNPDYDHGSESSSNSSEDDAPLLSSKKLPQRRTSKPMDKRKHLKNISNTDSTTASNNRKKRPTRAATNTVNLALSSDDDDDEEFEEETKWKPKDLSSSDDDDDELEILELSSSLSQRPNNSNIKNKNDTKKLNTSSTTNQASSTVSRFFSSNSKSSKPTSTSASSSVQQSQNKNKKDKKTFFLDDDDDDDDNYDDDFPMQSSRRAGSAMANTKNSNASSNNKTASTTATTMKRPNLAVFDDDSEDDGVFLQDTPTPKNKKLKAKKKKNKSFESDDGDTSDDENFAMALAMSESLMESGNSNANGGSGTSTKRNILEDSEDDSVIENNNNNKKMNDKTKKKNKIVYLDDDSDHMMQEQEEEEEEEDDAEVDDYEEEDAREAKSVLHAANQLSAQVLNTMAEWSQVDGGKKASTGMILNGALAIHEFLPPSSTKKKNDSSSSSSDGTTTTEDTKSKSSSSSSWISQDVMKRILPNVKLGDYQLIGVNWLALLHGMKCQVEGSKKKPNSNMNVNGVLADEMGLGKTVQTIAFLAWLKHRHDPAILAMKDDVNKNKSMITSNATSQSPVSIVDSDIDENKNIDDEDDDSVVNLLQDDDDHDDNSTSSPSNSGRKSSTHTTTNTTHRRPHIVIVPASVLSNWQREFEKFCPDMIVVKYHGTMKEREEIQEQLRLSLPTAAAAATSGRGAGGRMRSKKQRQPLPLDVVLTTFSYFSSEKATDRSFLRKFHFDYMVIDEAHCLKSARGMRYRNLNKFKTSHRLLLTGTPVQNSPKELMSLLCFLMPLFSRSSSSGEGDFDDNNKEDHGGESMLQHFVNIESNGSEAGSEAAYTKLKHLFAPFVLRRRKADVLSQLMPPKTRRVEWVPFDESTRNVYDSIVASHMQRREDKSASAEQHLFTALRKAANHPLLLRTRHKSPEAIEHLAKHLYQAGYFGRHETCTVKLVQKELEGFSDFDVHCAALELIDENPLRAEALSRYTLKEEDLFCSPKCKRLSTLLPDLLQKGHRVLIFSQWTRCLDLLGCLLGHLDLKYLRLDGQTVISERQKLIDEFNEDASIPVFLLSTRAGGMGINLTAADTCILHDLDFNPFNDIQAEDRCHRIGQKKPVTVIKMITEKTVDADIYEMQERKAKMNAAILENGSSADTNSNASSVGDKKKSAKEEKEEINKVLKKTFDRYLHSPAPKDDRSLTKSSADILV